VLRVTVTVTNREASAAAIVGGLLADDLPDVTRS
jgi:hypothetical protein